MPTPAQSPSPRDPALQLTGSIVRAAAQRPWLAALLLRRRPDWLARLAQWAQRLCDLPRPTRRFLGRRLASGAGGALLLLALSGAPAYAGGVVGTGDTASCTDAALDTALSGGGSVTFNCGAAAHTITVATTKTISANTTIDGGGLITLSGGGARQVIIVNSGVTLTLQNATISGGSTDLGGGIRNAGTLTVQNSTISSNTAIRGGGIHNEGTLTVQNSTISSNTASSSGGGGASATRAR